MLRDWTFHAALLAALLFWALLYAFTTPPIHWGWPLRAPWLFLWPALFYPVLEEIVFRGLVQDLAHRHLRAWRWGPISHANLYTSLLFTALHFIHQPPLWAAAVILPSLVFGYFKDKYRSLAAPILLHVFYNAGFFWLFVPPD
jgi:membrane protease YdiL (CAAX protease family)